MTFWSDFVRKIRRLENENWICIIRGQERFKMVSPIYKDNLYVGVFDS